MTPPGVLCLEGDWEDSLESRLSIESALRLLERAGEIRLVHRDVGTYAELEHYVDRWLNGELKGYSFAYFGLHGTPNTLFVGAREVPLAEFASLVAGRCAGKILYFASCKVLASSDETLMAFCKQTGARAIVGYTRDVDWVEAAAFELLMVSDLANASNMKSAYYRLRKGHPELTKKLGFRMAHSQWASERSIAADTSVK
ncbi:hypothetical protein B7C42_08183 [Nocardia cerradoensis]|uniref:CHAT domain-containing protein n=1 Tax=Nocardia cerradoensis TaxID=85688 RepID=A0A231GSZ0_9NOCA|nr:DUF6642 family protein [Nocardia cerradoensis]OXR39744.1 hypothetical protein B7C42_08183 [Nocardia cerradoensis]